MAKFQIEISEVKEQPGCLSQLVVAIIIAVVFAALTK